MDKDYFINDDDGYNWVSLSKPLSNYTQEELAEHLINNRKEYGTTQKIRIDGKIGAILTTDFCETPQDFLNKYGNILDRAGFKKGSNMENIEVKEDKNEKSTLKIKPKALSKVSLMDYTQEELAHLIMDDKIKNNDGTEYGVYNHRETMFDSTGCNTIEDFINKYQDTFKKMRIKSENPVVEQPVPNVKKDTIRVIEVPFGMMNYTQEDLAHLVMDNKKEDEVVGVKVNNGVILDSKDCVTVEDFIKKNEDSANRLGIKHKVEEKIEEITNDNIIPAANKITIDLPKFNMTEYDEKKAKQEEEEKNKAIENNYQEHLNNLLKTREIKKAIQLFNIPRGNYYNGPEASEESKLGTIKKKNDEYVKLFNQKDNINFNNEIEVSEWLDKLIPYINTHALNLNLGINVTTESADKYLLEVMEEKGYSTDVENSISPEQKQIARKLNELKEYHFFVSDYDNLKEEDKELNSGKTNAMAETNYLEALIDDATRGLSLISLDLAEINNKYRVDKKAVEMQIDIIDQVLAEKGDNQFDQEIRNDEERKANDAYKVASVAYSVDAIEKAISYINLLPEDSLVKDRLYQAARSLFNNQDKADYDRYPELKDRDRYVNKLITLANDKERVVGRLKSKERVLIDATTSVNKKIADLNYKYKIKEEPVVKEELVETPIEEPVVEYDLGLDKKETLLDKIKNKFTSEKVDEVTEGPKQEVISKIEMTEDEKLDSEISKLAASPELDEVESNNQNIETPDVEVQETIEASAPESLDYDFSLDDSSFDLSLADIKDSLSDFITIKSFKTISKELYDKINQDKVKKVVKKAVEKLKEAKKAACIYLGFAAVLLTTVAAGNSTSLGANESTLNTETTMEQDVNNDAETDETVQTNSVVENAVNAAISDLAMNAEVEGISLEKASNNKIADVLEGKSDVYKSFADAYTETNAVDSNSIYAPSWQTAKGGEYYVEENGIMNRLSKDEAEDYYRNGQDLVQSVENDGTVIGYVNIDNNVSKKSM